MADAGGKYLCDIDETDLHHVIVLQSWVRGVLVRRWMGRVRLSYEQLVTEVEKDPAVWVHWQAGAVCKPQVTKKKRVVKSDDAVTRKTSVTDRKNKDLVNQSAVETQINKPDKPGNAARQETVATKDDNLHDDTRQLTGERGTTESHVSEETSGFTSVETQTSLIEIVPSKQTVENDTGNVLDGIDTTWFNKAHKFDNVAKEMYNDEDLHLDLDSELESVGSKHSVHGEHFTQKDQHSGRFQSAGADRNAEGFEVNESLSDRSLKSCKSDLSARSRTSRGERSKQEDFDSYRSDDSGKDLVSKVANQSQRLSHTESGQRSHRSEEGRGQRSDRSGGFKHEKSQLDDSPRSHRSDGQKSYRSDDQRSHRSEGQRSHRSEDRMSNRSDDQRSTRSEDRRSHRSNGQRSQRSDRSGEREGQRSERSSTKAGQRSDRTERRGEYQQKTSDEEERQRSHRSDRSDDTRGQRSDRSQRSSRSNRSNGRQTPEQPLEKEPVKMPRQSSRSPVPTRSNKGDNFSMSRDTRLGHDSTTLTNVTSVWDSVGSVLESRELHTAESLPQDADKLREIRKSVAMELLWVQQAIQSRKNYLRLKGQI